MKHRVTILELMFLIAVCALIAAAVADPSELKAALAVNAVAAVLWVATAVTWRQVGGRLTWWCVFAITMWVSLAMGRYAPYLAHFLGWYFWASALPPSARDQLTYTQVGLLSNVITLTNALIFALLVATASSIARWLRAKRTDSRGGQPKVCARELQ